MPDYKTSGFTDEQVMIRDNVLGLLQRVLPQSKIAELDAAKQEPEEAFQALAADGWLALPFSEEWGGADASNKDMAVFIEALGYWHSRHPLRLHDQRDLWRRAFGASCEPRTSKPKCCQS